MISNSLGTLQIECFLLDLEGTACEQSATSYLENSNLIGLWNGNSRGLLFGWFQSVARQYIPKKSMLDFQFSANWSFEQFFFYYGVFFRKN